MRESEHREAGRTSGEVPRVREARQEQDWPFVECLYKESTKITHPEYTDEEVEQHVARRKERWFAEGAYALVAEQSGAKMGVIWVICDAERSRTDLIQLIAVDKAYRGKKAATVLLGEAIALSRGRKRLQLRAGIHENNLASLGLFEKFGFVSGGQSQGLRSVCLFLD